VSTGKYLPDNTASHLRRVLPLSAPLLRSSDVLFGSNFARKKTSQKKKKKKAHFGNE
jgi:hypothetical protein